MFSASEPKYTAEGGDVQVPWGWYSRETKVGTKGIDTRIGKANTVLRELYCSVVTKRDLSKHAKLSVF